MGPCTCTRAVPACAVPGQGCEVRLLARSPVASASSRTPRPTSRFAGGRIRESSTKHEMDTKELKALAKSPPAECQWPCTSAARGEVSMSTSSSHRQGSDAERHRAGGRIHQSGAPADINCLGDRNLFPAMPARPARARRARHVHHAPGNCGCRRPAQGRRRMTAVPSAAQPAGQASTDTRNATLPPFIAEQPRSTCTHAAKLWISDATSWGCGGGF